MSRSSSPKRRHHDQPHNHIDICVPSGRKHRYRRRKQALTALNRNIKMSLDTGAKRVYKCPHCGDFHLTSSDRP